jgi:hypothetical protein
MTSATVHLPDHSRCPDCRRAVVVSEDHGCPEYGETFPPLKWLESAERFQTQPEERNGGRCLRCGAEMRTRKGESRFPWGTPFSSAAAGAFAFFSVVSVGRNVVGEPVPPTVVVILGIALVGWGAARDHRRAWRPGRRERG